jgi:hypothetical protein
MVTGFLVVVVAVMGELSGVQAQYTTNLTTDEWAYVTDVGCRVAEVLDTTTLSSLGSGGSKWRGTAFDENVGKLYGAPHIADTVLIIDPVTNTTDDHPCRLGIER